ncbi:ATP-binding protein [Aneurinibacillus sp. Ricciae_BoGa-3]|uniref:sensor histidine kinase n=1 Tax=Aneurinibacillus sp. Ricciae_BoGa-3 TaxID=3022697 RepID=UPI00234133AF|nr:ATP-binding protein [Aneurinibacillus sp. Ricciae_BoGa-3]WCK53316.1 ATP-binding protein [Aneurinibacillus sp. Ricciae_BoGa-3]
MELRSQQVVLLWDFDAFGDRTKIKQVLLNLLSNAVKFSMDNTKIYIKAEQTERDIILSVKDEGIGIPEDMKEKIFNRFYQVDGTLERKFGGTGLGLPLTKQLVLLHGGTISVNSVLGEGSEFIVSLPNDRSNTTTIGVHNLLPGTAATGSLVF